MSSAATTIPHHHAPPGDAASERAADASHLRRLAGRLRPELALLLLVAGALNLWNLSVNGEANTYYSAAVKSMSESWSAFLWGTFDPAGLMTVDKPPLALWVQAASVRIFGFSSWAYLVPQALMGIAAVALTYDLTRRVFGRAGGFVAGLALALTPTAVAIFRHNNPDAALVLCITLALWATVRGLQDGRTRWLVLAGVAVGLGFEAKMAAALLVVPAIGAAWLWVRPGGGLARTIRQLIAFGVASASVGLAWAVAVWLTPAADRPWISGTSDNSIWSLILGYNGLGRLVGQSGGPGGAAGGGPGGGAVGGMFGGESGLLRLLNESLGSQGGWLLGTAVGAGVLILVASRLRRADARTGWLIAVGGAFATTAIAFSYASGIFHPYYVSALAPFTAALVGGGIGTMLTLARGELPNGRWVSTARTTEVAGLAATPSKETPARLLEDDDTARAEHPAVDASAVRTSTFAGPAGSMPERLWEDRAVDPAEAGEPTTERTPTPPGASRSREARLLAALGGAALIGGAITEAVVLGDATQMGWLTPVLFAGTIAAAGALVAVRSQRIRVAAVAAATGLLLLAPGVWSAQTVGHNVGSTFPTGGPTSSSMGGPGGGPGGGRGGFGPGGAGQAPPWAQGGSAVGGSSTQGTMPMAPPTTGSTAGGSATQGATGGLGAGPMGGGAGGGMFGGDQTTVTSALAYAKANGGGTVVVSGQMGAANAILSSGSNVAGIGGFSGRESEVSVSWFADRVEAGSIRWVVTSSGGLQDSRTGSNTVMGAVTSTCTAVDSVSGLYDCQGKATALRSAAS
jgi:4-amino-4-deoxy-L-arabinose transferase-like glycosyltransferase